MEKDLEKLVRTWQRPMYNLAYRMLGNEADAADATQEIFSTLLRNLDRYDPGRELKPWIYRVGTNVLLNWIRDNKLRREKENRAALKQEPFMEDRSLERKEVEAAVQREIEKLPEEQRAAIVLQYYHGLSQIEAAETLEIPRTTLQSRLEKGLDSMKKGLATTGFSAFVPQIETVMQSSATLAVPAKLSASLLGMSAGAAGGATGLVTTGGILMSKTIVAAACVVGALSLGIGFFAGKTLGSDPTDSAKTNYGDSVAKSEYDRLQGEVSRLSEQLAAVQSENRRLAEASAFRQAARKNSEEALAGSTPSLTTQPKGPEEGSVADESEIDWDQFSSLFAARLDLLAREDDDENEISEEERAQLFDLMNSYIEVARKARAISPYPIFHEEIFPELAAAVFGKSLNLDPDQLQGLRSASRSLLASTASGFDPEQALPVEIWAKRRDLTQGLLRSVEDLLRENQKDAWSKASRAAGRIWDGDQALVDRDLSSPEEASGAGILKEWDKVYGFDNNQKELARQVAANYANDAKALLAQFGSTSSAAEQARLNDALLRLQMQKEREFFSLLSSKQRENALRKPPTLLRFNTEGRGMTNIRRGPPGF